MKYFQCCFYHFFEVVSTSPRGSDRDEESQPPPSPPHEAGSGTAHGCPGGAATAQHQLGAQDLPSYTLSSGPATIPMAFANVIPGVAGGEIEEKMLGNQRRSVLNTCPCETVTTVVLGEIKIDPSSSLPHKIITFSGFASVSFMIPTTKISSDTVFSVPFYSLFLQLDS